MQDRHIIIVGLGLMGGSLARALRPHVPTLTAVERDAATRAAALADGVVDHAVADLADLKLTPRDWLILATPVRTIIDLLDLLPFLAPEGCAVLDLGSTKGAICRVMETLPPPFAAIGGHPMCGREVSGYAAGSADLYRDQTFILTPNARTTPALHDDAVALVTAVGARPLVMLAAEHDQSVALVSHMPYVLSSLLVQQAFRSIRGESRIWQVSASGFRDSARLAGSNPRMMRDILATNRQPVVTQLRLYRRALGEFIAFLENSDDEALFNWLADRQGDYVHYRQQKDALDFVPDDADEPDG